MLNVGLKDANLSPAQPSRARRLADTLDLIRAIEGLSDNQLNCELMLRLVWQCSAITLIQPVKQDRSTSRHVPNVGAHHRVTEIHERGMEGAGSIRGPSNQQPSQLLYVCLQSRYALSDGRQVTLLST